MGRNMRIKKGLCQCGCGHPTAIVTQYRKGYKKGERLRFRPGHVGKLNAIAVYQAKITIRADGVTVKGCTRCERSKPLEDGFNKSRANGDHRRTHCKSCERKQANAFYRKNPEPYKKRARAFAKKRYAERLADANKLKALVGCLLCKDKTLCVLDFHHVLGNSKGREGGMPVARAASHGDRKFLLELAKCVVVCANCHRKVHAKVAVLPVHRPDLVHLVGRFQRAKSA